MRASRDSRTARTRRFADLTPIRVILLCEDAADHQRVHRAHRAERQGVASQPTRNDRVRAEKPGEQRQESGWRAGASTSGNHPATVGDE